MSNAIDLVVQDKAIKGLDSLISKLKLAHEEILKINNKGIEFNKSGNAGSLKQNITYIQEYNKLVKATEKANIQADLAQGKYNKSLLEARERKNSVNRQTRLQIKYEQALEGVYSKMDAKLSLLNKEYRDLAVRKEIGVKLTIEEEKRMDFLIKKITKYDGVLKKVDAQAGKNQRNVGNYKSAFDGLGFSITQLAREAPAFANSMQTGFMAISNNLPMFFDEIAKTKNEVKALRAEGVQTQGTFAKLAKSLFSFQVLLSVGVTLLTLYGADLVKWGSSLFDANSELDRSIKVNKEYNKELVESRKNIGLEVTELRALFEIAKDETLEKRKRQDAINILNKKYPEYLGNLDLESVKSLQVAKAIDKITESLENKAKFQAAENLITKNYEKVLNKTSESLEKFKNNQNSIYSEIRRNAKKEVEELEKEISVLTRANVEAQGALTGDIEKKRDRIIELNKQINTSNRESVTDSKIKELVRSQNKEVISEYELSIEIMKDLLKDTPNLLDLFGDSGRASKAKKERIKTLSVVKEEVNQIELLIKAYKKLQEPLNKGTKEYKDIQETIDSLNGVIKSENLLLDENYVRHVKRAEYLNNERLALLKLQRATEGYIDNVARSSLSGLGMGSLTTFFDGTFDDLIKGADTMEEKFAVTFNAIADVAKDAFGIINSLGQQNFDAQYDRLSQNKEIAIQFAGDSSAAQIEIERQYEEKRKEIQKREAQANKRNALFNIALSTAQGVVSALAMTPPNPVLSGIIAGIGATQLAVVASQQIPEFKDGVRGFDGGLAIVGDGGVEEVIETDKGISLTPKKDTLVNLPKGANVYSNKEEFFNERLNNILIKNGIQPITNVREQKGFDENKLASLIGKELKKIPKGNAVVNFDEKGMHTYWDNGVSKKKLLNSRVRGLGRKV